MNKNIINKTRKIATPLLVARNDKSHVSLRGTLSEVEGDEAIPGVSNRLLNFVRSDKKFTPMRALK